jgi:methylphosphotriester-DNA--protein-cysteine methyltransferase
MSLAQLAGEAGVAREHVARAFRAHYGMAIGEYLRNRRYRRRASDGKSCWRAWALPPIAPGPTCSG